MNTPIIIPKAKRTVFTSAGIGDLGAVSAEVSALVGLPCGPIRLLNGLEGAKTGFGLVHIESHEQRVKQITGLGFRDVVSYVFYVASAFEKVALQDNGRLLFLRTGHNLHHQVICQWDEDMGIWSVTTAFPKGAVRNLKFVWEAASGG